MGQQNKDKFWKFDNPLAWGVAITTLSGILIIVFGFTSHCDLVVTTEICTTKFQKFWLSSPNEVGDTLAGLAGSLAFLWIIITVLLQRTELGYQREELSLQRIEWEKMAAAQEAQVTLLQKQGEIFAKEQIQRENLEAEKLFNSRLKYYLRNISPWRARYTYGGATEYNYDPSIDIDINFMRFTDVIDQVLTEKDEHFDSIICKSTVGWQIKNLNDIMSLNDRLSESQQYRSQMLGLHFVIQGLKIIQKNTKGAK